MITLAKDCLLFHLTNGEIVPFSSEMISVELIGETSRWFDPETASHAAKAVFHYFKSELKRRNVTADEFAGAMEKVLHGIQPAGIRPVMGKESQTIESDLCRLAHESGDGYELSFFSNLRNEFRQHLRHGPRVLHFRGLRGCVKRIAGARRWTRRCRDLEERIIVFLRECAAAEAEPVNLALVVE